MKAYTRYIRPATLALVAFLVVPPGALHAQERCDPAAGTLGIYGMRCEGCSFRLGQNGIEEARFRTEPQVLAVARGFTRGDEIRAGDRIVALDGVLVTTRAGGDALAAIRSGQRLVVRVRRDGRLRDLELVAGSACALREAADQRDVEVERVAPPLPEYGVIELPPLPPTAEEPGTVLAPEPSQPAQPSQPTRPAQPAPPVAPAMEAPVIPAAPAAPAPLAPAGYLGFGFSCSDCGTRDGVFFLTGPMVVEGIVAGGPAARAGLHSGDTILAVDGEAITGAGAPRFSAVQPGDTVRLAIRRANARREVTLVATDRLARPAPLPAPSIEISDRLRFDGSLGDIHIDVRGAPVRVTRDERTDELVIRTSTNIIRLKRGGG